MALDQVTLWHMLVTWYITCTCEAVVFRIVQ